MARPTRRTSGNSRFYLLVLPVFALAAFAVFHAPVRAFEDPGALAKQPPASKPLFSGPPPIQMSDLDLLTTPHTTPAALAPLSTDASTSHDRQPVITHDVRVKKPSLQPLPPPPNEVAPGEGSTIRFRMSSRPIEHVAQRPTTFDAAPVGGGLNSSVGSGQISNTLPVPNRPQRLVTPTPEQIATPTQQPRTGPWRMFAESRRSGAIRYGSMPTTVRQRLDQLRESANRVNVEPTVPVITPEEALAPIRQEESIDRGPVRQPSPVPAAAVTQPVHPSPTVPREKATVEIGEGMAELVHRSSPLNHSLQPTPAATAPALTLRVGPQRVRVQRPVTQRAPLSLALKPEKLATVVDSNSLVETKPVAEAKPKPQHLSPIQVRMAKASGKRIILPAMRASTSGMIAHQQVSSRRTQQRLQAEATPSPLPELQPTPALEPQAEPQLQPTPALEPQVEPQVQPQAEPDRSVLGQRLRSPRTRAHKSLFHALDSMIRTGSIHTESREPTPAVEPESQRRVTNEPAAASAPNNVNKFFSSLFSNHTPRQSLDPPLHPRETREARTSEEPVRRRSSLDIPFLSTILGDSPEPTPAAQ